MISRRTTSRSRFTRAAGFTLIEVLVTMALMAAILPVAMRGISIAISAGSSARHRVEAATLGQAKLAELVSTATIEFDTSQLGSSGDFGEAYPGYSWSSRVVDDVNLGVSNVTFTVSWLERGSTRTLDISTMVMIPTVQ